MNKLTSKFYLVGIKGNGMCSLACYLKDLGHEVLGSDVSEEFHTDFILKERGIKVNSFNDDNITEKYIYIIGYSQKENIESKKIYDCCYEYYMYGDFIRLLDKEVIAVSGTHGKTSTAKILSTLLKNEDVSYIIGDGSGYGSKKSNLLVLEACEYMNHFHCYLPYISIINNIDFDHPDFFKNEKMLIDSFQKFANRSQYIVVNGDDERCFRLVHDNKTTFGFNEYNDYVIKIIDESSNGYVIKINDRFFSLPLYGIHNIYNFTACFVVCDKFFKIDIKSLELELPKRRMEEYRYKNNILIDDYAHHPNEIIALNNSLRHKYKDKELIIIFQPHTYIRTFEYKEGFINSLSLYDRIYIYNTFLSRCNYDERYEKKVNNIFKMFNKINEDEIINLVSKYQNKVYVFCGAGNLNKIIYKIIKS